MIDLISLEKTFISSHIKVGEIAVDFTMGNGNDTVFLSHAVGESGKVFAFDIQNQALINTENALKNSGCPQNYTLILDSHSNVRKYVLNKICVGIFNLGYLPSSGNKTLTTMVNSTLEAVSAAIDILDNDGLLLVAVYPGHPEGKAEGDALNLYFATLDRKQFCATRVQIVNSPISPFFFVIEKK